MTVALCMIVRNEAHVIRRCLESHKGVIDYWVICDTGSSDGTQQVIRDTMAELGIPGELHERPWVDFGHNKTEMLQLAKGKADYLLHNDADHIWHGQLPEQLTETCYSIEYSYGGTRYGVCCLLSDKLNWRYVGVLHEFVESVPVIPGMWAKPIAGCHIEVRHEGARSRDPETYKRDAEILEAAVEKEPDHARYVFYLAQSYRDSRQLEKAIVMYGRRIGLVGWDQEEWYARYQIGLIAEKLVRPPEVIAQAYLSAFQARPTRAEPLYRLAVFHRLRSEYSLSYLYASEAAVMPYTTDGLFVEENVYTWQALDELSITAWHSNHKAVGKGAAEELLKRQYPPAEAARIATNCGWYGVKALDKIAA